jgi:DNA-binding transcriptional MerR regulator
MLMAELSKQSAVPIPTIKYYLREGLLFPGVATAPTRARYDESHIRRLRLIRALLEIGDFPLAAIRRILAAVDDETVPAYQMLGTVQFALGPSITPPADEPDWLAARDEVSALLQRQGWRVLARSPARDLLISAMVALRRFQVPVTAPGLDEYAQALAGLAADEIAGLAAPNTAGHEERSALAEAAVAGMVLYERVIIALRRLAQEDAAARRFGTSGS